MEGTLKKEWSLFFGDVPILPVAAVYVILSIASMISLILRDGWKNSISYWIIVIVRIFCFFVLLVLVIKYDRLKKYSTLRVLTLQIIGSVAVKIEALFMPTFFTLGLSYVANMVTWTVVMPYRMTPVIIVVIFNVMLDAGSCVVAYQDKGPTSEMNTSWDLTTGILAICFNILSYVGMGNFFRVIQSIFRNWMKKEVLTKNQEALLVLEEIRTDQLLGQLLPVDIIVRYKMSGRIQCAQNCDDVTVMFANINGFERLFEETDNDIPTLVNILNSSFFSKWDELLINVPLVEKIKTTGFKYITACGLFAQDDEKSRSGSFERTIDTKKNVALVACNFAIDIFHASKEPIENLRNIAKQHNIKRKHINVKIGLESGCVVAGIVGNAKFVFDIYGDTVNTASRMQLSSEPGRIMVTEKLANILHQSELRLSSRGTIPVKGKGNMAVYYIEVPNSAKEKVTDIGKLLDFDEEPVFEDLNLKNEKFLMGSIISDISTVSGSNRKQAHIPVLNRTRKTSTVCKTNMSAANMRNMVHDVIQASPYFHNDTSGNSKVRPRSAVSILSDIANETKNNNQLLQGGESGDNISKSLHHRENSMFKVNKLIRSMIRMFKRSPSKVFPNVENNNEISEIDIETKVNSESNLKIIKKKNAEYRDDCATLPMLVEEYDFDIEKGDPEPVHSAIDDSKVDSIVSLKSNPISEASLIETNDVVGPSITKETSLPVESIIDNNVSEITQEESSLAVALPWMSASETAAAHHRGRMSKTQTAGQLRMSLENLDIRSDEAKDSTNLDVTQFKEKSMGHLAFDNMENVEVGISEGDPFILGYDATDATIILHGADVSPWTLRFESQKLRIDFLDYTYRQRKVYSLCLLLSTLGIGIFISMFVIFDGHSEDFRHHDLIIISIGCCCSNIILFLLVVVTPKFFRLLLRYCKIGKLLSFSKVTYGAAIAGNILLHLTHIAHITTLTVPLLLIPKYRGAGLSAFGALAAQCALIHSTLFYFREQVAHSVIVSVAFGVSLYLMDALPRAELFWTALVFITIAACYRSYQHNISTRKKFLSGMVVRFRKRLMGNAQMANTSLINNILPATVVSLLYDDPDTPLVRVFESASMLMMDIVKFTVLSQVLSAEEVLGMLNLLFCQFDDMTYSYGLEKISTIGDAYVVAGGVPQEVDGHAERMCSFAIDMCEVFRTFNRLPERGSKFNDFYVQPRIGIHTGMAVGAMTGGQLRFKYDIWGPALFIAEKLKANGLPMKVHISQNTRDLVDRNPDFIITNSEQSTRTALLAENVTMNTYFIRYDRDPYYNEDI